jgi:hypothetical protein
VKWLVIEVIHRLHLHLQPNSLAIRAQPDPAVLLHLKQGATLQRL